MRLKLFILWWGIVGCSQVGLGQHPATPTGHKKPVPARNNQLSNPKKAAYQAQLQTWCDGLLAQQVADGADAGGFYCPAHQFVHGRCADTAYPLFTLFELTGVEKYRTAARNVLKWSEAHVSQPDGSWINEAAGRNDWKGISCFSTIALGETLRHHGTVFSAAETKQWRERLRKGGDFILSNIGFDTGDINYPIAAAAALAVCWTVLGDDKYRHRARELAYFGLAHFTTNHLIWGEGVRGANDTTANGLRPIDVPYNLEESLPNLALYGTLTGDKRVLDSVTTSLQAHLNWMLPDGGLDAGWCSRQYKWTYFGSLTADGCAGGFALMGQRDNRFSEASRRNLHLRKAYTHNGLLQGGADLASRAIPVCNHHTFASAKGIAAALDADIQEAGPVSLPNDVAFGVREWPEARVIQLAVGPWRASVTTNDLASSPKRGGHPMGGALSMLWHQQTGPVAVASMNDYVRYEGSNMQEASAAEQFCLTPRIEAIREGRRYANLYDPKATLTWSKQGDSIQVTIRGDLRDVKGNVWPDGPSAFELRYTVSPRSFQLAVHARAAGATLLFPVVSPASERVDASRTGALVIHKKTARINLGGSETAGWKTLGGDRVFNFVPGFEAVPVATKLDRSGHGSIRIVIDN